MAKASLLPRGFKTKAEKTALALRRELGVQPSDPLCGFALAAHMKISVYKATDFFPEGTNLEPLIGVPDQDKGWSALTLKAQSDNTIIIHNHLHSGARQQSNLMHELAHAICEHKKPERYKDISLPFFMRDYDPQQEEEAIYLGSTLQITRDGLLWALRNGMEITEIAKHYNASTAMVQLRINSTGVKKQLSYSRY